MAKLPQGRTRHLTLLLLVAASSLAIAGAQADDETRADLPVDLIGTWHVLIHYTDENSHDPTLMRWDDKIWVFEPSGSRLRWSEYPIVVFADQAGRFETRAGSRLARVLHGWEPNERQRGQIAAGLEVNQRGSKSKTLRQNAGGWRSASRPSASSAMVITYIENWEIADASGLPVFRREDTLGSATSESYDGVTEFATTAVESDGDLLRGTFERDGTRHGIFRLTRSGTARTVKGTSKSEGQRFYDTFLGEEFREAFADPEGSVANAARKRASGAGDLSAELRAEVGAAVRAAIEASIRAGDEAPGRYEREVDSLTRKITAEILEEGRSLEEIDRMLAGGEINP